MIEKAMSSYTETKCRQMENKILNAKNNHKRYQGITYKKGNKPVNSEIISCSKLDISVIHVC